jgi:hypothetical protein
LYIDVNCRKPDNQLNFVAPDTREFLRRIEAKSSEDVRMWLISHLNNLSLDAMATAVHDFRYDPAAVRAVNAPIDTVQVPLISLSLSATSVDTKEPFGVSWQFSAKDAPQKKTDWIGIWKLPPDDTEKLRRVSWEWVKEFTTPLSGTVGRT